MCVHLILKVYQAIKEKYLKVGEEVLVQDQLLLKPTDLHDVNDK